MKVLLIRNDEVLKRRRSTLQRCSDETDPIFHFHEEYIFTLDSTEMLDDITITFTVICRNVQGHSTVLGKVNVGSVTYAERKGLYHWQKMIEVPNECLSEWHDIR